VNNDVSRYGRSRNSSAKVYTFQNMGSDVTMSQMQPLSRVSQPHTRTRTRVTRLHRVQEGNGECVPLAFPRYRPSCLCVVLQQPVLALFLYLYVFVLVRFQTTVRYSR
jgi:hypothetical protein